MLNNISISESIAGSFTIQKITRNNYYHQNTYILIDNKNSKQIIIDPGDNAEEIEEILIKNKYKLSAILFTHGHFDHVGASNYLSEKFNVDCYVHAADLRLVKKAPNYALLFENKNIKSPIKLKPFTGDFNEIPLEIIHTPGHTEGSCCFLLENIVFTGDTLLLNESGRTDLPGGSEEKLKNSLSILFALCNNDTLIYPGHGEIFKFTELKPDLNK